MAPISFRFSGHLNITDQADTKTKLGDRASTASDDVASSVGPGVTDVGFVYQASISVGSPSTDLAGLVPVTSLLYCQCI
jgi:hypothetical protein